ncbi:MerR family transcriptional regulator [Acaricomes phytoseiuli]|uniref:heat shock protein transcriptional repressor HspR n=1 Tax=Acaricomes phytoseiuli TaxID=291968 RepID=UPI00036D615B|nr:MerR family transcriptional regulator [Acaricomes phytoseiuli]MCW1248884.1 MerR family transcriptional regulator [Acaricomes phytoseiuli]
MAVSEDLYAPVLVISAAAELAELHPQTLRQYDRLGLVSPSRAPGRSRRYSHHDVEMLREVQRLSHEGVSLAGIKRILALENQVLALQSKVRELSAELKLRGDGRVFAAGASGDVVSLSRGRRPQARTRSQAVVIWRPHRKPGA